MNDDLISRQAAIDIERNATVDTNPSHFEVHQKFTQFMDDAEISSFGRWQWSNGFNTALTAVGIDLKKLPSAQPEPQWIPVSERLPEKSANYLVTVRWYREDDIEINVYEYNAWHKEWNDGESCGQRVIAWMPLPEAYKPKKIKESEQ